MKGKIIVSLGGIVLVIAMVTSVIAFGGPERGWGRGPGMGPCGGYKASLLAGLGLTDEQEVKIAALREAHLKEVKPLQDKIFSKRGDLRLLWLERTPDQAKIIATEKELRQLHNELDEKRAQHRLAVYNVLTPEQRAKIGPQFLGGADQGRGPGRGHGHGYGGGFGPASPW